MTLANQIRSSSVFLVSGGAKGITAKCIIRLAQNYPCKFILLGRSELLDKEPDWAQDCFEEPALKKRIMENLLSLGEKPTPISVQKLYNKIISDREIKQTLKAIQQAGGEAEYLSVDVTDVQTLQQKLATVIQKTGAITGIIHGAGNLADKLIEKKTEQDFEKVYTAKVKGLENLLSCVKPSQLEYLVLFSSVTGFYGNIGQSDYAIANEILNKSAHLVKQRYPSCHVVAINWGGWDSGMVTPELKKEFARRGIDIIPVDTGTQMLVNELHPTNHETAQVVIGSPLCPPPAPLDPELRSYRIRRRLSLEANPFLQDHVIAGKAVLPATCAVSWIVDACEQLYPGYRFFSNTDFKVLKGINFNESVAKEYIVDLQEIGKTDSQEILFQAKIWSQTPEGKINYHFSIDKVQLLRELPTSPTYEPLNLKEDKIITNTGKEFYQHGKSTLFPLFHGASFQELKRVINITPEKITTECVWHEITDEQQGQFPVAWVNPYSIDLSTHPLWIWMQYFHQEICLPAGIQKYEQFLETPCNTPFYVSCEVKTKTATSVIADFIVHDGQGKVYSRLLGGKGIIIPTQSLKS
ncbi:SDR family NAD(P)-dependent oxidoreductase [Aetokthonos hydrillicola Thurmond2011]|jgi:acyl transferase domain-containing protein|uniref:SDR family NAD(P)-dependent oxidoreductase n=1 Tax=Aetokthonos hydrillicola Thurmond2011 TaxID=2712845 RepID=A0AAP5MBZ2_9CYAN|nr:SDR family NAD(P)-dependent oxidoreductase [Aetokthonos hydrillicola]MBO3461043.1 SDR family NAD(P)-dependent oxidoreductase [Aetokthonos hydrillicola CCALA 1050]MBW4586296.1 SDR family NAD(P)-dependent oxidoreductase [Aetokthonos hydrillicola CCALA 1050]MDR9897424.1 SDR family NAD(P)-dependent oxidoreductase [Aetokthonos hydrillicola Thurmond2011]